MPPLRTRALKTGKVVKAFFCDVPGCGKSVSRPYDLVRHKLIHFTPPPFQCKERNVDGTPCQHDDRQLGNLVAHLKTIHGISTTVKALHRIYPKPAIPPQLRAEKRRVVSTSKKCKAAKSLRAADVDDAPPEYTAVPSPNAHHITSANPAPVVPQSSTASIAAQTATFSGWVAPALRPATSTVAAPLPAALAYAVQSTTYAGWVSADALNQSGPYMPQGTMGVFQAQVQEPFVYTREQTAQVNGSAGYQQELQGAVAQPSPLQSNAFITTTTTPAFDQSWTEPQQAYTAPVPTESSFFYSQQQQFQGVAQSDAPLAHADNFLAQWTWTDGYTLDQSCTDPTPPTSDFSPSSFTSFISSPSSSSSSSWSPPTSPTALAYPDLATIIAPEQEYTHYSGSTVAPLAFTNDFEFTGEGLTQSKGLAVAALAEFSGAFSPVLATGPSAESESKSGVQSLLEPSAQAMADFETLFGTEVTPEEIEADYLRFTLNDLDPEALSYWASWGQC